MQKYQREISRYFSWALSSLDTLGKATVGHWNPNWKGVSVKGKVMTVTLSLLHIVISWSRNTYLASFPKRLSENPVFACPISLPPPHSSQCFKHTAGLRYVEEYFWICTAQKKRYIHVNRFNFTSRNLQRKYLQDPQDFYCFKQLNLNLRVSNLTVLKRSPQQV